VAAKYRTDVPDWGGMSRRQPGLEDALTKASRNGSIETISNLRLSHAIADKVHLCPPSDRRGSIRWINDAIGVAFVMARFDVSFHELPDIAVQGGAADALFELGLAYCSGRDGEIDLIEAHKWFNLAALRGNSDAKRYRSELASEMSRDEVGQAQRRAREWLSRH
jgi:uncharacterized protein